MMRFFTQFAGAAALLAAALLVMPGCTNKADTGKGAGASAGKGKAAGEGKNEHDHPEKGPHGGPLAEWGEEKYHAEVTFDHGKKQATVYILDGEAKKPAPVAAETVTLSLTNVKPPVQVTLKADPQEGDAKGQASRFTGTHDQLGKEMDFEGEVSGTVAGTPYAGTFKHKDDDHEHKKK